MRRLRWSSEGYVVGQYDSVWKTRYGNASRVDYLFLGNWMRGLVGGLQNRPGPFDSDIALLLCISTQVVKEDSLQNYYVVGSNPA